MRPDLYTQLFQRWGFPTLDHLNGTTIHRKLAFLLESEYRDPSDLDQEEELARVVGATREGSGFYRRLWSAAGEGPRSAHAPLDGLPVVTKAHLAEARSDFPLAEYGGKVWTSSSSGSTGRPMIFHRSSEQESWFWALRFRIWRWAGYRPGDPYLTINLNPRLAWKKRLQDRLFRCAYLTFNADNLDARRIVATLERKRILHLEGFSSSLYALSRYMLEHGLQAPTVRGVTATGDTLFPVYREAVESAFGVRVLDYYGAGGEGVHLASQCPESGSRYHIHPEDAVVELLDADGPVPPGKPGRIVVTQLHNEAMPLVRYELGDLAVPAPPEDRCACGRSLPMLERLEGRIADLVVVPDGTFLVPHFFVVLFKGFRSLHRYQIRQEEPDRMRVLLAGREGCRRSEVEAEVRRAVAVATRSLITPEFEWVDEIPLSGAGKRRLVISEVSNREVAPPAPPALSGARTEA